MTAQAPPMVGNPYVGPTSFRPGDELFGRDQERDRLLDLLVAERIVLLYSPSGAGKTSLIQAALVSALREAGFEVLPVIRVTHALEPRPGMPVPRNRYVLSVLLSLEEGLPPERQRSLAELASLTLREYLAAYADRDRRPGNEVLIFDQFEEALTADPTDEAAKHEFFRELGEALRDRGHWALFAMREDFLAALDPYLHHLPTRLRTTFRLDLLSVPEALEAMRRPAQLAGVDFTEAAAHQLVDDLRRVRVQRASGTEEVLGSYVEPVQLQVACHLLWSMLPPGATAITPADVDALGRVDQALAEYYAERVTSAAERTGVSEGTIRDWFEERLITPQGLRSQVLEGPDPSSGGARDVLAELVDAHLVRAETRRQAIWYELAHDRLIEPVRRDNAAWRAQHLTSFERAAALWDQEGRPARLLLLGADLGAAEHDPVVTAGALRPRQREFLEASRRADEQVQRDRRTAVRMRRLTVAIAVAGVIALVLGVTTWVFVARSLQASRQAEDEAVRQRLLWAAQQNLGARTELGLALTEEAVERHGPGDLDAVTREIAYRAATASPVSLTLGAQPGPIRSASLSADGSAAVSAGAEDIRVWDRATGEARAQLPLEEGDAVTVVETNRDASAVVAGLDDGRILVWDVATDRTNRWDGGTGGIWNVLISPDGTRVTSIGDGPMTRVWDLEGDLQFEVADAGATEAYDARYSPDGRTLVTVGDAPMATLRDADSGAELGRIPVAAGGAQRVVVGPGARTVATVALDQTVTVWDTATGQPLHPPDLDPAATYRDISPDLSRILSVYRWGAVGVVDAATGTTVAGASAGGEKLLAGMFDVMDPDQVFLLPDEGAPEFWHVRAGAESAASYVVATSMEADHLVAAWDDGTVRSTDITGHTEVVLAMAGREDPVWRMDLDPTGTRAVIVHQSGGARLWDVPSAGAEGLDLSTGGRVIIDAAFLPDGSMVLTGDDRGRLTLWDARSGAEVRDVGEPAGEFVAMVEVTSDGSRALAVLSTSARMQPLTGSGTAVDLVLPPAEGAATSVAPQLTVTAAALLPGGETAVLGTSEGRVVAFDTATGDLRWDEPAHQGGVLDVVTGASGELLTIGSAGHVVSHAPDSGEPVHDLPSGSILASAIPTPDGDGVGLFGIYGDLGTVPWDDDALTTMVRDIARELTPAECEAHGLDRDC